ncbi:MAG: LapA family protein [Planctomycetota bacterium]
MNSRTTKARLILIALGIVLALIVIFQNTESVRTRFLFITLEMPRAGLLALTFAIGLITGLLLAVSTKRRRKT